MALGKSSNRSWSPVGLGPLGMVLSGLKAPSPTGDSYQDRGGRARCGLSLLGSSVQATQSGGALGPEMCTPRRVAMGWGWGVGEDSVSPEWLTPDNPGESDPPPSLPAPASVSIGRGPHGRGIRGGGGAPRVPILSRAPCSDVLCGAPVALRTRSPGCPQDWTVHSHVRWSCRVPRSPVFSNPELSGDVPSLVFTGEVLACYKFTPRWPQCFVIVFDISPVF